MFFSIEFPPTSPNLPPLKELPSEIPARYPWPEVPDAPVPTLIYELSRLPGSDAQSLKPEHPSVPLSILPTNLIRY